MPAAGRRAYKTFLNEIEISPQLVWLIKGTGGNAGLKATHKPSLMDQRRNFNYP